jgi:hypothetical protein
MLNVAALVVLASSTAVLAQSTPPGGPALEAWVSSGTGGRYIGTDACVRCHTAMAGQRETPMAHALERAGDSDALGGSSRLTFREGTFTHRVARTGARVVYSVSDGAATVSAPVAYAFGSGVLGQTFVLERAGGFYESRVSYFRRLSGLDVTIGQEREPPSKLADAIGRRLGPDEVRGCFGCHAPQALERDGLRLERATPGVSCEGCHGPGQAHAAAMAAATTPNATPVDPRVFNPGKLASDDLTQRFCGSCHLSFEQAMLLPGQGGAVSVRFQAYRLFISRGHRGSDARISCIACHDPHAPLERDPGWYDVRCTTCHSVGAAMGGSTPAGVCPMHAARCVSCHMPKVELPGMHGAFTDHDIRIVTAK